MTEEELNLLFETMEAIAVESMIDYLNGEDAGPPDGVVKLKQKCIDVIAFGETLHDPDYPETGE